MITRAWCLTKKSLSIILIASGLTVSGQVNKAHLTNHPQTDSVSTQPEFPGGKAGLNAFLGHNLRWPTQDDVSGTVFVQFTVTSKGLIINPKVVKAVFKPFDNEALRVIKLMPKWKPARNNNKPVASSYTLPIHFIITG